MSDSVEAGKVVITGAGGGIGLGLAQEFARRGFNVVALLRDATKRAELDKAPAGLEDRVEVQQLDVRNAAGYQMPQDVSILVNNAGIRYEYLPVEEIPMAEWREYFEVNSFGVVELCRLAIPHMRHVQGRTRKMADRRRRRTAHGRFHRINDGPGDRVKSAQGSDISAPADHQSWRRGACIVHPPQPRIASIKHAIRLTAGCSNNHLTESEKRSPAKGTSFLDSKSDYRRTAE